MANKKITELTEETSPAGADLLALVDDVSGTPTTKKVTVTNLMGQAPVQSVNTATGAVVLDADDIDDTSTTNKFVTAADITNLGNLSGTNTGDQDLSSYQLQPAEGAFVDGDKTKLDGLNASNYASATHTHALDDLSDVSVSSPSSQDVVKWTGSQWEAGQVSVDLDTPLNTALRGTNNPHIGGFPNQSFKVADNPDKSVMVMADADGNLDFVVKTDDANIFLNTPSSRKAASFGFSVVEDANEPDIEVASGGENYSVISGDSDTLTANGLPFRQGFNNPDIGAYAAPILISGGSIA